MAEEIDDQRRGRQQHEDEGQKVALAEFVRQLAAESAQDNAGHKADQHNVSKDH